MLIVGNGPVVTRDAAQPYLRNGCVVIKENVIMAVGPTSEIRFKYPGVEFIDAQGRLIMPGLINTHMHLYSTFARGMALKDEPPLNFSQILQRLWWRLDKVLTVDDLYYSAMVPLIECIKHGTTTIFDHHASPGVVRESLFHLAQATRQAGVRACLCYEVSDRDGEAVAKQGIAENAAFIVHCQKAKDSMLTAMFGLHASFTLSDQTLRQCMQVAAELGAGVHVHTAEGLADVTDCLQRYGKRVVERFADSGLLGEKTIAAHCVHISEGEMHLLKQTNTAIVHNPASNMGNAVGCAPAVEMLQRGLRVGLGTDGYTTDMFETLKMANLLHKHCLQNPSAAWSEPPQMLFVYNRDICTGHFLRPVGQLAAGAYADIIIVDYDPPTPMHEANINEHILFGMAGGNVHTTIINGRVLMYKGKLLGVDEHEIYAKSRELAEKLWHRF